MKRKVVALLFFWCLTAHAQALRVAVQAPFILDPHFLFLGPNMAIARDVFDSLVGRDADANWTPSLAQSWRQIDDKTWEFKLRQGVKFSDGSPFTANDVVASFNRVRNLPNNPSPYTPNLRTIVKTDIVDPYTIRIHTDVPNPTLPGQLTNIFIIPARFENAPASGASTNVAIGTGPYKVMQFRYGDSVTLVRNDQYWGPKPAYAQVTERVMTSAPAREAALLSGDVDLIENVPPDDVARLRSTAGVHLFVKPADRVMFLMPNTGKAMLRLITDKSGKPLPVNPLRDLRVRQAISMGIDRSALVSRVMSGEAIATMQLVPQGFAGWTPDIPLPRYDPVAAKKLLAEASYPNGFRMTISCTNDRYVYDSRVCQTVAQLLARIGIDTVVNAQPGSTFMGATLPGVNEAPILLYGLSLSSLRDVSYSLGLAVHTRDEKTGFGQGNRGGFSDPTLDKIIQAAVLQTGPGHEAAVQNAQKQTIDRLALIPLYQEYTIEAGRGPISYVPRMDEQLVAADATPTGKP